MNEKVITFKYKISNNTKMNPSLKDQINTAKLSIDKINTNKNLSFQEIYINDSAQSSRINSLDRFQNINEETEKQWKEDAYGTVNSLKNWKILFKALDNRKRYLRRLIRDNAAVPNNNETPETEEQPDEGSLEEDNSEDREDSSESNESRKKRRTR